MGKFKTTFTVILLGLLHSLIDPIPADAQSTTGVYSVTVNTPGTFGQVMLQTVDNWSDVVELTIAGHLNDADMVYFSRMQNMTKLDLTQVDISSVSGCGGLELLRTVVLPESVTRIADYAFGGCTSLSTINLDHVVGIGASSFSRCVSLKGSLYLPNLVTLGDEAFYYCTGLTAVVLPIVTEIGSSAFNMGNRYDGHMLTSVIIPKVNSLGSRAFQNCMELQSIDIPNCTYIGAGCFTECMKLSAVTLSDELEVISEQTFQDTNIKSINLPSKLKTIGSYAFESSQLSTIDIPEGVIEIDRNAFYDCPLESITLPSTLRYIDDSAFYYSKQTYSTGSNEYSYILKDVYCKRVVPILTMVFNNDMAKGATLHVPALSVSAYKLDDNWYKFNKIEAIDGDLSDVTINNTFTIIDYSGLATDANLTLASSDPNYPLAGHLTISGNSPLSLGNFIQHQNFMFEHDYNGFDGYHYILRYPYCSTLITNNEVRANNITTKMLLPTDTWSFISLPYDVNVSDITVPKGTMWVVRKYNGANRAVMTGETWEDVTVGQTLNAGEGYIFHCIRETDDSGTSGYVEFEFPAVNNSNKNNIFRYNDVVQNLKEFPAEFSHNRSWNLIGNPYPSFLNSQYIDFPSPITVWDGYGYTVYSLTDDEYVLRPNEAFFVQCPVNTNRIEFHKDGRTHDYSASSSNQYYLRAKAQSGNNRSILNFILADDGYSDRARLVLNEAAAYGYEIERDASKFMSSNSSVPQIYIIDNGIHYAIDERPIGTGEYSLGVRIGKEGTYKILLGAANPDYDILLVDKETNATTDLSEKEYSFEALAQTDNSRFTVKILPKGSHASVDVLQTDTIGFTVNGQQLSVDSDTSVTIYSIDGRLIHNGTIDGAIELPSGIYLLSINNRTHKVVIK